MCLQGQNARKRDKYRKGRKNNKLNKDNEMKCEGALGKPQL